MSFATLYDALAERRSSHCALTYIEGENAERKLQFSELYPRALGLLRYFQSCGAGPGSEMILLLDSNEQFVDAFWACILGNIIAVPLAPGANDEHRLKLFRVLDRLKRPHLCTDRKIFARLAAFAAQQNLTAKLEAIRPATVFLDQLHDISQHGSVHPPRPGDIAFVQYSSGSTSEPKGVALTHGNLLSNIAAIAHGIGLSAADSGLSWMPLTHDMGLIGFHLTPLVMDVNHCLMATAVFVRRPQLWLAKASEKKATVLCSPNFGYRHFLKNFSPDKNRQPDLSRVRILFNGAEPISVSLCQEFLETLAPRGLRASVMFPVYGLAEASVAVTFPSPGAGYSTVCVSRDALTVGKAIEFIAKHDPRAVEFIRVGRPVQDCELRLASDDGKVLPANTIGHVLIRGANVSRGYYNDAEATRMAINAEGWLDTGDLGFKCNGDLVITGRAKDIRRKPRGPGGAHAENDQRQDPALSAGRGVPEWRIQRGSRRFA